MGSGGNDGDFVFGYVLFALFMFNLLTLLKIFEYYQNKYFVK